MPKKKVPPKKVIPFAKKKRKAGGIPFKKGHTKTGGRKKGTPNKLTVEVKDFLRRMIDDPTVQKAVRDQVLAGEWQPFFKALAHVHGNPVSTEEVNVTAPGMAALITLSLAESGKHK